MKGYRCLRKGGWDTHGLPVELEVERELGINTKQEIEAYGVEKFNERCRKNVFRYVKEWEDMTDRIAFWVDMNDPYVTLHNSYIETEWWILKQIWEKGLIYRSGKVVPHCPRCDTSLSSHEVAQGYQEDTPDPSVFIKFRVLNDWWGEERPAAHESLTSGDTPAYLLAWTTTPWTLPGNTALAVDANADYSLVELAESGERLVLASALVDTVVQEEHRTIATFKGEGLADLRYSMLYNPIRYDVPVRQFSRAGVLADVPKDSLSGDAEALPDVRVVCTDFVTMDEGTGIVHMAPAFGDVDFEQGSHSVLYFVQPVDSLGKVTGTYPFADKFVKDADGDIMADLETRGILYKREIYRHTYPFCWRCDSPLLYYAKSSWYIRTTAVKEQLVEANESINWYPGHIGDGRFGEWLRNNVDWAISRERYWGTPIPIWQCEKCNHYHCVGSRAELKDMAVAEDRAGVEDLDLHRPYVDNVRLACPECDGHMHRIPEIMDVWFDSGSMPVSQWHYPFEGDSLPQDGRYPADYICEAVDQTRGWFYSLHAIATLLENATDGKLTSPSYRNVICLGHILDEKGQKMSKHLGNVVNPWDVLNEYGADPLRWYLFTASAPGDSRRFSSDLVGEVVRRFFLTLWNTYSFFVTYANIDEFHPSQAGRIRPDSELDRWILSELNTLILQVDDCLSHYNPTDAGRRIEEFVELLSNWYVRRSRRRFWKSENDEDKNKAYATLYRCLVTLSKLLAPLAPFLADKMYQNLVAEQDEEAPESVHLAEFPTADESAIDQRLMDATRLAMRLASLGRAARSSAQIRVRQPLRQVLVGLRVPEEAELLPMIREQVLEELNVKDLAVGSRGEIPPSYKAVEEGDYTVAVDTTITPELADEGMARELVRRIQNLRRGADFDLTDKIITFYTASDPIRRVMESFGDYIRQETLSDELREGGPADGAHSEEKPRKLNGEEVALAVKRV
jgi:isoleucyl-tRNA synthetase